MINHYLKKFVPTIFIALFVWLWMTDVTYAAGIFDLDPWNFAWALMSNLMQVFLTMTSWLVGLTGTLMNVSIGLTTNIGSFVNDTPVIYTVWEIIRDLASMVLIFFILWAAIQMIVGIKTPNFNSLIFSIIIMGILINFSFFFTRVLIDASNIVSLQFLNAIAPGKEYVSGSGISDWTLKGFKDGGLSDIFMGSLAVNKWYDNAKIINTSASGVNTTSNQDAAPIRIVLVTLGGMIVMIFASLSFLGAAAAAILRLAMLIFLLAFSPIWIASIAMPQLKDLTKDWFSQFKAHLLFLPVYLMFMYVAIRILTESKLNMLTTTNSAFLSQDNLNGYITLFVGFAIVIIMLNLPLIAAVKVAGAGSAMSEKWFKGVKGAVGGWMGRSTVGRVGYSAGKYINKTFPGFSNTLVGQSLVQNTAGRLANARFGGQTSATAAATAARTRASARTTAARNQNNITDLQKAVNTNDSALARSVLNRMTNSEKAQLDKDKFLKKDVVLQHLDEGAFKAIDGNSTLTDADKADISNTRMGLLKSSVSSGNTAVIANMMKNASGATLAKLDDPSDPTNHATVRDQRFITHIRQSHLKDMDHIDPSLRKAIGDEIYNNPTSGPTGGAHPAFDHVNKNRGIWG
ncbi:MAG: hypothetical protein WCW03_01390 [Candidatus Paceibacterota bacterium]|jgi:hypothetical protein